MIVLFVFLIFPHELGHFVAARACGVQVNEFAFGMGPALWKKQGKETLYSIRLIPIGGFCAMEGEDTEESGDNPRAFNNKKWWQKIIILLAGATMNIVIAILTLSIMNGIAGLATTTVETVLADSPAAMAGLAPGDEILSVNGQETDLLPDVAAAIQGEDPVEVTFLRDGQTQQATMTPVLSEDRYLIGVTAQVSHSPFLALREGALDTVRLTQYMFTAIKGLFTTPEGLSQVSGPVGMVSMVSDTSSYGWHYFLYLVAIISLNLAIFNLLPFPALDGGRIIFVIIRRITGRVISDKVEARVHAAGMVCLLALMLFATWNDIGRLFGFS